MKRENDPEEAPETVGPYRLVGRLGRGGMGLVYRAWDERLKRHLAIKRMLPRGSESRRSRARFQREAQAAASLNHPSIVQIYDIVETDSGSWIAMELVEGETLQAMIRREPIGVFQTMILGRQIAEGLAEAHGKGIVHRDLKAENVMVTASGQAKILDFGLAKRFEVEREEGSLSVQGAVLGTYRSMSPEQALGQPVDYRSDLFSLGILLYEMLGGRSPFQTGNPVETLARVCSYRQPPLHKAVAGVPEDLSDLVDSLLEKDRQHRPQGALAVAAALTFMAAASPGREPATGWIEQPTPGDLPLMEETVLGPGAAAEGTALPEAEPRSSEGSSARDSVALTTLLLSDLEDSTRLVERMGDSGAASLFRLHDRLARDLLARFDGQEVDKTDGFLLLFQRPIHAVLYARAYHEALRGLSRQEGIELRARVGIHVGEVVLHENSAADVARGAKPLEVEGLARPVVSRLRSLACGGQTLISRGVYDMARRGAVGEELGAEELRWLSYGSYLFAGVEEPLEVFEVGVEGLSPLRAPEGSTSASRVSGSSAGAAAGRSSPGREGGRTGRGWVAAALLASLVLLALWALSRAVPTKAPSLVAVLEPRVVSSADPQPLGLVVGGVRAALLRGLMALEGVAPLSTDQVDAVDGSPTAVARAVAAAEVLSARLDCAASACQVFLGRLRGETGEIVRAETFTVPVDDLLLMNASVESRLRRLYPERRSRGKGGSLEVEAEDYESYLRLREDLHRREGVSLEELAARAERIAAGSARFFEIHLLAAEISQQRYLHSQDPAFVQQAFASLQRAGELWPENPLPLFQRFDLALDAGLLPEAETTLAALREIEPGNARILAQEALLLEAKGEPARALAAMRVAAERRPSWPNLMDLASMEYRQGEVTAAREHLRQLLERGPGLFRARALLAQLELLYGEPEVAVGLYEELVERSPTVGQQMNLGLAYFLVGRYPEAAASFRAALELAPGSPYAALNLADSELLGGDREAAMELYARVVRTLEEEASGWQQLTVRAQALAQLGRGREAVETVQRALRAAPENPQVRLEAAIVYALVGEVTSCLVHVEEALERGVERRWFRLPWFDPLRENPDFQSLLDSDSEEP